MLLRVQSLRTLRYVNASELRYIRSVRFERALSADCRQVLSDARVNLCGPENIDHASTST